MSYQIIYGSYEPKSKPNKFSISKALTAGIVAIVLISALHASGYDNLLWQHLIPGNPTVTTAAFENMTESLKNGNGISEAIETFCVTVLKGAQLA